MMTPLIVDIYRSAKKDELYVYLDKDSTVDDLPDALKKHCGALQHSMRLLLTPEKKLARADAEKVIEEIKNTGFYVQMPLQQTDDYMQMIPNDKLQK